MAQAESPTEPTFGTDERVIDFETAVEATHIATDDPESHREADPSTWHPNTFSSALWRKYYQPWQVVRTILR